jgi:aryl carrier-like protein
VTGSGLFLCGAGNPDGVRLALRINAAAHRWDHLVLLDDNPTTHGRAVLGVVVAGAFDLLRQADTRRDETTSLVTRTTQRRWAARERIAEFGLRPATLISPTVDTLGAEAADDVVVYPGAELGVEVRLGRSSAILVGATVGHESVVGECCIVGPGAVLNARVRLGEGAYVGSNAVILGAGTVVTDDVPAGATVAMSPAEVIPNSSPFRRDSRSTTEPGAAAAQAHNGDPLMLVKRAWLEVLRKADVSVTVNFFEAGGDSLGAIRVVNRLRSLSGNQVTLVDFYRFPTIGSLANHLGGRVAVETRAQRRMDARQRLAVPSTDSPLRP